MFQFLIFLLYGCRSFYIERAGKEVMKEVMIVVGAGQISMDIMRRMGAGKKIILGDKNIENAKNIQKNND